MKKFLYKIYKLIWQGLLCRSEPFTYQLARMLVMHGIFFWGAFLLIVVKLSSYLLNGLIWQQVASGIGLIIMAWLLDHLVDHIRANPNWYGDA